VANIILGMDTTPHDRIRNLIKELRGMSRRSMSKHFDRWSDAEDLYKSYRVEDTEDSETEAKFGVKKIVVPYTFAQVQTVLHFLLTIFTQSQPTLRYEGREPADVLPARLLELIVEYDYTQMQGYVLLYNWIQATLVYGVGVVYNDWMMESMFRTIPKEDDKVIMVGEFPVKVPGRGKRQEEHVTKEGNLSKVVDPFLFFYDPRVPIADLQDGEFAGHRSFSRRHQLIRGGDIYYNVSRIPAGGRPETFDEFGTQLNVNRRVDSGFDLAFEFGNREVEHTVTLDTMVIDIVPSKYGLGPGSKPEHWLFTLANNQTIIRSEPSPFPHGMYPYSVLEAYPDSFTSLNNGIVNNIEGLQNYLSWLFNSHMANVRKVINDVIVVDPSRIEMDDLTDPERPEGAIVRVRRLGYGQDVNSMLSQLRVEDVTRGHLTDSSHIMGLIQRVTGASDTMMGQPLEEGKSATEVLQMNRMASARLGMMAQQMDRTGFVQWKKQLAGNRQEFTSLEQFFALTGESARELGGRGLPITQGGIGVNRQSIQGNIDFPPLAEITPFDKLGTARIWQGILEMGARFPALQQELSLLAIFRETVRHLGIKNIDDYKRTGALGMVAEPDTQFQQQPSIQRQGPDLNGPSQVRPEEFPSEVVHQRQ